jgi:hypothetical protein
MVKDLKILSDKSLLIIFAYAAAGLGHLRVTDALYHGLPKESTPILLGTSDTSISILHRIMSVHPLFRTIMEWAQHGRPEKIFTRVYRRFLRRGSASLYKETVNEMQQRIVVPEKVLIVATHFGLAHEFAAIKKKLELEQGIKVVLAVQVTDDSPQQMWYVDGADVIFVPSKYTRDALVAYGASEGKPPVPFEVVPYPVSPLLSHDFNNLQFAEREEQLKKDSRTPIRVMIPVSGAAVGTDFFTKLIDTLYLLSDRIIFHLVSKEAPFTASFLKEIKKRSYVRLYTSSHDRNVVGIYESVYNETVIALEITKPSEQAFKALLTPGQTGGSILLFSTPVGRQEYDNLNFLERHSLIPNIEEQQVLFNFTGKDKTDNSSASAKIFTKARVWRGIRLPPDPVTAARLIWRMLGSGIFSQMVKYESRRGPTDNEVSPDGVYQFWSKIIDYL